MAELRRCAEAVRADGRARYLCNTLSGCSTSWLECSGIWLHAEQLETEPLREFLVQRYASAVLLAFLLGLLGVLLVLGCQYRCDKRRENARMRRADVEQTRRRSP